MIGQRVRDIRRRLGGGIVHFAKAFCLTVSRELNAIGVSRGVCSVTGRRIWVAKWDSFVAGHVSCGAQNVTSYVFLLSFRVSTSVLYCVW
jgi:hypothetical protein